jgi:hypothetical protein
MIRVAETVKVPFLSLPSTVPLDWQAGMGKILTFSLRTFVPLPRDMYEGGVAVGRLFAIVKTCIIQKFIENVI